MWHACSGHATLTWCCVEFSTPVCAYVTRKVLIYGSGIGFGQIHVRSQNPGICQNLDFSLKVEILARSRILAPNMDPSQILVRARIWPEPTFWPDPGSDQILAVRAQIQVRLRIWSEPTFWPDPGSDLDLWSDLAKVPIQALYIDHFQLPPRWKMTGEDGDPFGKSD